MRVLVIRHHDSDDSGFLGAAFAARGAEVSGLLLTAASALPEPAGFDHIVVLGADWSVYDGERAPWIAAELAWLRAADLAGVPVLGICFGAQALCAALGGAAEPAPRPEIGWVNVEPVPPGLVEAGPWLEFHSDRCILPPGARLLARTPVCAQAFTVGRHLGVQFHPEVGGAQMSRWLRAGGDSMARRAGQHPAALLARTAAEEPAASARADRLVGVARALADSGR